MALTKYERGNTIKTEADFKVGGVLTNPSGATNDPCGVKIDVIKPDGTYLISAQSVSYAESVGEFYYYFNTASTDPMGIYKIVWKGYHTLGEDYGYKPIIQREDIIICESD